MFSSTLNGRCTSLLTKRSWVKVIRGRINTCGALCCDGSADTAPTQQQKQQHLATTPSSAREQSCWPSCYGGTSGNNNNNNNSSRDHVWRWGWISSSICRSLCPPTTLGSSSNCSRGQSQLRTLKSPPTAKVKDRTRKSWLKNSTLPAQLRKID